MTPNDTKPQKKHKNKRSNDTKQGLNDTKQRVNDTNPHSTDTTKTPKNTLNPKTSKENHFPLFFHQKKMPTHN